jgi:hypothetical protein
MDTCHHIHQKHGLQQKLSVSPSSANVPFFSKDGICSKVLADSKMVVMLWAKLWDSWRAKLSRYGYLGNCCVKVTSLMAFPEIIR